MQVLCFSTYRTVRHRDRPVGLFFVQKLVSAAAAVLLLLLLLVPPPPYRNYYA